MDVGSPLLRQHEDGAAPVQVIVGQPVTDSGSRGQDHHVHRESGGELNGGQVLHAPVIGHTAASTQAGGPMTEVQRLQALIDAAPAGNAWTLGP